MSGGDVGSRRRILGIDLLVDGVEAQSEIDGDAPESPLILNEETQVVIESGAADSRKRLQLNLEGRAVVKAQRRRRFDGPAARASEDVGHSGLERVRSGDVRHVRDER